MSLGVPYAGLKVDSDWESLSLVISYESFSSVTISKVGSATLEEEKIRKKKKAREREREISMREKPR